MYESGDTVDLEIHSLEELYHLVSPSLKVKKEDMIRKGINYINEADIWNYLKEKKWVNSKNLELYQIVSDILHVDDYLIDGYLKEKMKATQRKIYFEED